MESNPEKFCPIANATCRHDECMMQKEGECLITCICESIGDLTGHIEEAVDPDEFHDAVHFFAVMSNAPMFENTNDGDVPWFRVRANVENMY